MYENIRLKYFNPQLHIGLQDVRTAWLVYPQPVKLQTTVHRSSLVFRLPGSGKRISYQTLKKGLLKKDVFIQQPLALLPF